MSSGKEDKKRNYNYHLGLLWAWIKTTQSTLANHYENSKFWYILTLYLNQNFSASWPWPIELLYLHKHSENWSGIVEQSFLNYPLHKLDTLLRKQAVLNAVLYLSSLDYLRGPMEKACVLFISLSPDCSPTVLNPDSQQNHMWSLSKY